MFFTAEEDEQDFLSTGGGSKLASVFGLDRASSQGGNESLTYTAPKQPKKKEPAGETAAAAPSVMFATVVQAYKFVDNQYASQGKVGAAILANHAANDYRILLYYNKQQQVTNAKISQTLNFNVQANNYANFYDDGRINWSVLFNNAQDVEKFAKEVGLAKALSAGGQLNSLVQQDMQPGEGGAVETGDSVEVRYSGWLLTNNTFGQVFDSNASSDKLFRFKVGKGKVIKGWDTGMMGMKKGGKRLLVIPPSLAYGAQGVADRVPANATLIFEVEVVRVKLAKGDSTPDTPAQPPVASTPPAAVPSDILSVDHEDTVKERTRSITEQLSHSPKSDKAKLISRMAKMGQPMLPMSGAVPAHPDSEEEPPSPQPSSTKPHLAAKPHLAHPVQPSQAQFAQMQMQPQMQMAGQPMVSQAMPNQPMVSHAMAQPYGQPMSHMVNPAMMGGMQTMPGQTVPVSQPAFLQNLPGSQQLSVYQPQPNLLQQQQQAMFAMQQQQQQQQQQMAGMGMGIGQPPPVSDAMTPMLLSETRQQTTEVRLTVSKMSDKVDRILEKVEALGSVGGMQQPLPAPTMESSILLHNISRIVQENERLKKDVFEKGDKIETQNEKIAELLQKNQRYVEKSNTLLEERNEGYKLTADQSQIRILALEQEKVQIATELSSSSARLASLQLELGELRKTEGELRHRLQNTSTSTVEQKEELDRLRLQRAEDEKKVADLLASLKEEKTARKQTDSQLTALQEEIADLKANNSTLERNVNERKRKAAEERRKLEEEAEEIKAGLEQEIQTLREKLRKQRTSTDSVTSDKVTKMEEELTAEWQAKCDKMVAAAADRHARQLATVREDLQESQDRAAKLEAKIQELRSSSGSTDAKLVDLQQQVEENAGFREKYENLRGQATAMKQKYEERIQELESETETIATRSRELQQQLQQARQQLQQQQQQQLQRSAAPGPSAAGGSADVAAEVKKVMNSVYQSLRGDFDAEESYTGAEVLSAVLNIIKVTTLKLVQSQTAAAEEEEDDEEEEEDEEDEDEDENKEVEEVIERTEVTEVSAPVPAALQRQSTVEEPLSASTIHATHSQPVGKTLTASTGLVTGDRGNPYYSKILDGSKDTAGLMEQPMMALAGHVTGDKGNPYYSQTLDKSAPVEEPVVLSTESSQAPSPSQQVESAPSTAQHDKAAAVSSPAASIDEKEESEDDKEDESSKQEKPSPVREIKTSASSEEARTTPSPPLAESSTPAASKSESEKEKTVPRSAERTPPPLFPSQQLDSDSDEDMFQTPPSLSQSSQQQELSDTLSKSADAEKASKSEDAEEPSKSAGKSEPPPIPPLLEERNDTEVNSRERTSSTASEDERPRTESGSLLPTLASREPPPLFDDEEDGDSPLFGADDTVADTLGSHFKPPEEPSNGDNSKGDSNTKGGQSGKQTADKLPSKSELLGEDDLKPKPPPPLFGDDDDDEDLDWLN